jgi:hypothetical protein
MIDPTLIIGEKYSKLTILEYAGRNQNNRILYKCECECGNFKIVERGSILNGRTRHCGCVVISRSVANRRKLRQKTLRELRERK